MSTTLIPNRAVRDEAERLRALLPPTLPVAAAAAAAATTTVATATVAAATVAAATVAAVDAPLPPTISATYDGVSRRLHVRFLSELQTSGGTDLILVLDNSGSMDLRIASPIKEAQDVTRLDIAIHSARVLAGLCTPNDRLSLVTFSSTAQVDLPFTLMNDAGKVSVDAALKRVYPQTATNLWDALRVATELATQTPRGRRVAVILLTDGEPTVGTPPRGLLETLPILSPSRPWVLHALGFSDAVDSKLLSAIADWGRGSFGFIPSGDMVGTVCINTAAHCLSMAHPGLSFVAPTGVVVETGPLVAGQSRDFVFPCDTKPDTLTLDGRRLLVETTSVDALEAVRFDLLRLLDSVLALEGFGHILEERFLTFVKTYASHSDERVKLLLRDVVSPHPNEGQLFLACRYLGTWGWHYLRCYRSAQRLQHCANFKDVGLQGYGGPLFRRLVVEGDKTFALMPPMETHYRPSRSGAGAAGRPAPAPIDYSLFHNASGGCFDGDCRVRMSNDDMIPIRDLRRGDLVWTPDGPASVIYAVELNTRARAQPMTQIGRLAITPWHPIRRNGAWLFPAHVHGFSDRLVTTVYNLVLSRGHVVEVEGTQCVTLAHGFHEDPVAHAFFGTRAVIEAMQRQPGFAEGRPVFENLVAIKNDEGIICGWRDYVVMEEM
jgi:Mg-chelatase subunit ChlD